MQLLSPFVAAAQAPCTSDSDCADYEVCSTQPRSDCPDGSVPSCAEGQSDSDCAAAAEAWKADHCVETDADICLSRWLFPCNSADDCGPGFQCTAAHNCQEMEQICTIDSDCPPHWTCPSDGGAMRCIPPQVTATGGSLQSAQQDTESGGNESSAAATASTSKGGGCTVVGAPVQRNPMLLILSFIMGCALMISRRWRKNNSRNRNPGRLMRKFVCVRGW